jgi:hydrogenase/urease accessory protein HupE
MPYRTRIAATRLWQSAAAAILLCAALAAEARAHDPGLSALDLRLEERRLLAHLTFSRGDLETLIALDTDGDGQVSQAEFGTARPLLDALAADALDVRFGGRRAPATVLAVGLDESDGVHFHLSFPAADGSELGLRSTLVARLPRGHRQYLSLRDGSGIVLAEKMLDNRGDRGDAFEASDEVLPPGGRPGSFRKFLALGAEHILTGYDHLVFLLGLLLAGGSFRTMVRIVTSFTVAHSITLALATLDVVRLPSSLVEPLIAISIVYIGLENIFGGDLDRRWLLTFGFGLVHGFGFASVLRELGIGAGSGAAVPLLSFNLGVELGQIALVGLTLPLIWQLSRTPAFARWVPACSLLVSLAGAYWLAERMVLS